MNVMSKILRAGALATLVLGGPAWAADPPATTGTITCSRPNGGVILELAVRDGYRMCSTQGATYIVRGENCASGWSDRLVAIFSPSVVCAWIAEGIRK